MGPVSTGIEQLVIGHSELVRGRRCALLCHAASIAPDLRPSSRYLCEEGGAVLEFLLAPEHGVYGLAQDMETVHFHRDPVSGLDVYSLYGDSPETLRPSPGLLDGLDVLIADLQDVGSRYYTYVWTLIGCLEAAADAGVEVVVCDRPNPIGGEKVEGWGLEPGYESFVGAYPVPVRHGMTVGELAKLYVAEQGLDVALTVVPMKGWRRSLDYDATGLVWVPPSPNMPFLDTAFLYPGLCLVEGTDLSEGRGTTRPFELVGSPSSNAEALRTCLADLRLPGVGFRSMLFRPMFQKHAGRVCAGVGISVLNRQSIDPCLTGLSVLWAARRTDPDGFAWRKTAYEFVRDIPAIDLLAGGDWLRRGLAQASDPRDLMPFDALSKEFLERRRPYLLYD